MHGFDEFFGNFYHLNAEEEPENPDYPKDPAFRKKFGPRGVLRCKATDKDDTTIDAAVRQGRQADDRKHRAADAEAHGDGRRRVRRRRARLHGAQTEGGKPWFCYMNTTRMHIFTHLKPSSVGKTGLGVYPDGMVELDGYVGQLLDKLDELKVADNTIVMLHHRQRRREDVVARRRRDALPRRKRTRTSRVDGAFRSSCAGRASIEPGRVINDICSLQDMIPTFAAAAGEPNLVEKVKKGYAADGKTFKVHLDGENLMPFLKGDVDKSPREGFLYWSDDGELLAVRVHQWKATFAEQRAHGLGVWREPFSQFRVPKIYNLRSDPFEEGEDSTLFYDKWMADRSFLMVPAQAIVAKWLESLKEFPVRQKPSSFSIDEVVERSMPKTG